MIGIDFTFVFPGEVKKGYLYRSYEISTAAILDAFCEMGIQHNFVLIVNHYAAKFISDRFPKYKICSVNFLVSDVTYRLTNGKKSANTWGKKFGAFCSAVHKAGIQYLWYPCGLPKDVAYCDIPYLCTVNDIIHFHKTSDTRLKGLYKKMIEKSDHIVTISDFVNKDVRNSFSCDNKKITTIPVSIKRPEKPGKIEPLMNRRYILDINGFGPHKNTMTLVKAYERICNTVDYDLCLCGGWKNESYFEQLKDYLNNHGLTSRVKIFFGVSNADKNWLLWNATLFVTPSLNEGFGMTPVEAAMCSVPVISTKAASLYEVTQGMAKYVEEPEAPDAFAVAIKEILNNYPDKQELNQIAVKLERRYSSRFCAEEYWKLFKTHIGHSL